MVIMTIAATIGIYLHLLNSMEIGLVLYFVTLTRFERRIGLKRIKANKFVGDSLFLGDKIWE